MQNKGNPNAILLSKRANIIYLERAKVLQKDDRVLYLTVGNGDLEQYFNIPEKNTALLLLGQGTSITSSAARKLADSNVMVGFCGTGGAPLFSTVDPVFLSGQSEYRPTEYMQAWARLWFNDQARLDAAKEFFRVRLDWTVQAWGVNQDLIKQGIAVPERAHAVFLSRISSATSTTELLSAEGEWARNLYQVLALGFGLDFKREEGEGKQGTKSELINSLLDHGNYIAYGFSAVILQGLGISFAMPILHGKTRRGGLVFDVADRKSVV